MNKKNGRVLILELTLFAVFCVIFYAFLCKCDLFTGRFGVPRFTGMLLEET